MAVAKYCIQGFRGSKHVGGGRQKKERKKSRIPKSVLLKNTAGSPVSSFFVSSF
jgi:hypothetical protein